MTTDTDDAVKAAAKRASEQLAWHKSVAQKLSANKPTTNDALRGEMIRIICNGIQLDHSIEAIARTLLNGPIAKHTAALQARIAELEVEWDETRAKLKLLSDSVNRCLPPVEDILADAAAWKKKANELEAERDRQARKADEWFWTAGEISRAADNAAKRIAELEAENDRLLKAMTGG